MTPKTKVKWEFDPLFASCPVETTADGLLWRWTEVGKKVIKEYCKDLLKEQKQEIRKMIEETRKEIYDGKDEYLAIDRLLEKIKSL